MHSPILGGWSVSRSQTLSDNQCVNLFPSILETKDGKSAGALYMAPGLDLLATVGSGPIRGLHAFGPLLYVVSGASVYSVTVNWVSTLLGTIADLDTPVSIIDNGRGGQVGFFDGQAVYVAPGGSPLTGGSIGSAGTQYQAGDDITLTPDNGISRVVAVLTVTTVGAGGAVTGFSVSQGGAYDPVPTSFSQLTTTGSGSGFTLVGATFGAFSGIVQVNTPFDQTTGNAVMIDEFALVWELNTNRMWQSNNLDLSIWDPLNFAYAQARPDNGSTMIAIHDQMYAIKQTSTEIWVDAGTNGFAFAPEGNGTVLEVGCIAPFSVAKCGEVFMFLSQNDQGQAIVIEMRGYAPIPVSTQALVGVFQKYSNIGDAIGYSYQQGQHVFYVLIFPEDDATWVYDVGASAQAGFPLWHQRAAFDNGVFHRHWSNAYSRFLGAGQTTTVTSTYCADPVTITSPTVLATAGALGGTQASFATFVFSDWVLLTDDSNLHGIIFCNQDDPTLGSHNPGLFIKIANDQTATPQIEVLIWDASNAAVLNAQYAFTTWAAWVNVQISVDTTTQTIQVFANTVVAGALVESQLTPTSLTWSSTNPVPNPTGHPWKLLTASS
jgi:hypothetical protein